MLFHSFTYFIFLPFVVITYHLLPARFRWILLLAASYYFYMCWKPIYATLILFSTSIDFFTGLKMDACEKKSDKKPWLMLSLISNLLLLFVYKYTDFFSTSFNQLFQVVHLPFQFPVPHWLLPVGISFYTFQSLSYTIDVYRGNQKAEPHFGKFALFVSFFPQLVAGPIERSTDLMPQIHGDRNTNPERIARGVRLILWGFFKKLVVADRLSPFVDSVYNNMGAHSGLTILMATYAFAFQIYGDFSGYSDIAKGSAQLLGIDLMENFKTPYFSTSIVDYWRRWHVSLSTWFRDYVYYPLGGNKQGPKIWARNILIVFIISGLWHGAAWVFVFWGVYHGVLLLTTHFFSKLVEKYYPGFNSLKETLSFKLMSIVVTFHLVCFGWVFFRSSSLGQIRLFLSRLSQMNWTFQFDSNFSKSDCLVAIAALLAWVLVEATQQKKMPLSWMQLPKVFRWSFLYVLFFSIIVLGVIGAKPFIYFQF
ncbi:MAG: MBOAT family O-acyltransferase [Elusimicrobiota bacterium]